MSWDIGEQCVLALRPFNKNRKKEYGTMISSFRIEASPSEFNFSMTTDENGNLVGITATDANNNVYECRLQLMPEDVNLEIQCCTATGCTPGSCGG